MIINRTNRKAKVTFVCTLLFHVSWTKGVGHEERTSLENYGVELTIRHQLEATIELANTESDANLSTQHPLYNVFSAVNVQVPLVIALLETIQ